MSSIRLDALSCWKGCSNGPLPIRMGSRVARGVSPRGAHRTVRDSLPSYGCSCPGLLCKEAPMHEQGWFRAPKACEPLARLLPAPAFVLPRGPFLKPAFQGVEDRTQGALVERPIVHNPLSNNRTDFPSDLLKGLGGAQAPFPPFDGCEYPLGRYCAGRRTEAGKDGPPAIRCLPARNS